MLCLIFNSVLTLNTIKQIFYFFFTFFSFYFTFLSLCFFIYMYSCRFYGINNIKKNLAFIRRYAKILASLLLIYSYELIAIISSVPDNARCTPFLMRIQSHKHCSSCSLHHWRSFIKKCSNEQCSLKL